MSIQKYKTLDLKWANVISKIKTIFKISASNYQGPCIKTVRRCHFTSPNCQR